MAEKSACVLWPGARDKDGYGFVKIAGRQLRTHRVALEKRLGRKLEPGECALHSCHQPACVNADHLRPGTVAENNRETQSRRVTLAKSVLGI